MTTPHQPSRRRVLFLILLAAIGTIDDGRTIGTRFGFVRSFSSPIPSFRSQNYEGAILPNGFGREEASQRRNQQFHRRCRNALRTAGDSTTKTALPRPPTLLSLSSGSPGGGSTQQVVYSVFSKPPKTVFRELLEEASASDGCLRLLDIAKAWDELNEIVEDGDVTVEELQEFYNKALVDEEGNAGDALDEQGFERFYRSIDDLFDDDDDDEAGDNIDSAKSQDNTDTNKSSTANAATETGSKNPRAREDLVEYLEHLQSLECDSEDGDVNVGERRPWGLDCSDKERFRILEYLQALLVDGNQRNLLAGGNASPVRSAKDLTKHILGTWELKYTSSRTMIINKSLSGLGRSTSDLARNLGLQLTLSGNYYYGKAEFVERFGSNTGENDSENDNAGDDPITLEATVTGEWILETGTRVDSGTGRPSVSLRIEVETIAYGPTKSSADQWDSLSPIKLVDVLYLDEEVMVLRGNSNADALFVYALVER